jgi:acylpyruvate hydrolase
MRFVTFEQSGAVAPGVVQGDRVTPLRALAEALPSHLRDAVASARDVADVAGLDGVVAALHAALKDAPGSPAVPLRSVRLLSPVVSPGRVIGVGLNYRSHAEEQGARIPRQPILFAKWSDSVVGPGATVAIPYAEAEVDYECEVAVVIGRAGRDIPIESALEHVFGITALNDLSDRKAQLAERQWTRAKSFDGFCPMGPAVVTLDEIPAVGDLAVSTTLNGVVVQQGSTSDLIFDIPTLVAFASQGTTLRPGDVIATGTPSGVGFVKDPPVYLRPGDVVTVAVEHVGELPTVIGAIAERTSS